MSCKTVLCLLTWYNCITNGHIYAKLETKTFLSSNLDEFVSHSFMFVYLQVEGSTSIKLDAIVLQMILHMLIWTLKLLYMIISKLITIQLRNLFSMLLLIGKT